MEKELPLGTVSTMLQHYNACKKYLDELRICIRTPGKQNTLLDAAMQQIELCCIDMRNLCEQGRPTIPPLKNKTDSHKEIYGEISQMANGWLDIRLNALLPHCKMIGGTQYVYDTITRLIDRYQESGGKLPHFDKSFVAIVEHCPEDCSSVYDNDNKGFKAVINALKGRVFDDDNKFELSLGLFNVIDSEISCHIYVTPYDEAADFLYQMSVDMLF